jgi:hypothetical protein
MAFYEFRLKSVNPNGGTLNMAINQAVCATFKEQVLLGEHDIVA